MTDYTINLLKNNVIYQFVLSYLDHNSSSINEKYGDDLQKFNDEFEVNAELEKSFLSFAGSKDIEFNSKQYETDRDYILARLKAQIARNFWKNEGWYSVLLKQDNQVTKALTLFNEAKDLAKLK